MYYYSVDSQLNSTESTCRPNIKESNRKQLLIKLPIFSKHARRDIQFKIDSGAFGNLLPIGVYKKLYPKEKLDKFGHPSALHRENVKLVAYNGTQIEQYGKCLLTVKNRNKNLETFFHIVPSGVPILGLPTSEALGLIAVNCSIDIIPSLGTETKIRHKNDFFNIEKESKNSALEKQTILREYSDVFEGVGCFQGECSINVDESIPPAVMLPRHVPHALKEKFKEELHNLVEQDIIAPLAADEHADWLNSFVCAAKKKGIRLCLDPAKLNEAIIRPYHYTPTLDDILQKLNGAKYLSILDARSGYWNIKLDKKSSYYTTFGTEHGRFRFLRLPFGVICASDMFQKKIDETYSDLRGVCGIADDIVVVGYKDDGT
ncbi:hypothetical protein SNE40_013549 [Patella caerulea]|uniref:Reverse transcriptase domain-containing protein n=1 Tax=Patella caerulea TaxID=87958 RepID=A0AAN8JBT7_PATCE